MPAVTRSMLTLNTNIIFESSSAEKTSLVYEIVSGPCT